MSGRPQHIIITRQGERRRLWKFVVLGEDEEVIDYSFASTRGLVWGMAKRSWRRAERRRSDDRRESVDPSPSFAHECTADVHGICPDCGHPNMPRIRELLAGPTGRQASGRVTQWNGREDSKPRQSGGSVPGGVGAGTGCTGSTRDEP